MIIYKILKYDRKESIYIKDIPENYGYIRAMLGATCSAMFNSLDTNVNIDIGGNVTTFNDLIEMLAGIDLDNPVSNIDAINYAILYIKKYNDSIVTNRMSMSKGRDRIQLIEVINVIDNVKPKETGKDIPQYSIRPFTTDGPQLREYKSPNKSINKLTTPIELPERPSDKRNREDEERKLGLKISEAIMNQPFIPTPTPL